MNWQPSASVNHLRIRAQLLKKIRDFFAERGVMEVETPLLCSTSVTATHIGSLELKQHGYLQTSPEYAMKRLLAAGSGCIYQISKAFRQDEVGSFHNPEFTMLEWYRVGFNHHHLMNEVDALLQTVLHTQAAERKTYAEIFTEHLHIDPHAVNAETLEALAKDKNIHVEGKIKDKDTWLQILMSHCIEPQLGILHPCFIYDYPASLAALARIQSGHPSVASRFEVYMHGMELANGFHELADANEQRKRFEENLRERKELGLPAMPIDEFFLAALLHGLPDCAGVALGIDRLVMLAIGSRRIADVLSFDFSRV